MTLHALDAIDDALSATRRYRPSGFGEWVWVAVVAGTVASPGIGLPTSGGSGGGTSADQRAAIAAELPSSVPDVFLWVAAAVAVLWVLFVVTGAFLEFPFLRWLRDGDLAVREESRSHWRQALGLAGFRLVVNLVSFAALGAVAVAIVGTGGDPLTYLFALGDYWVLFAPLGLATGLVAAFTTAFVVPAMWLEDRGVVGGWRRIWPTLTGAPKQFLAYAVGAAVLASVGGILVVLAAVLAFVPVAVLALLGAVVADGTVVVAVTGLLGGVLMTVVVAAVYALVQIFLRFYALFVLGDVADELDVIPGRRRAVRDGGRNDENAANAR